MAGKVYEQTIRVRYKETDRMGVVYHSNYLVYFEVGRTEFLRSHGAVYRDLEERRIHLVVTEATCRYVGPLRYDDLAVVSTWVSEVRKSRMTFRYRVDRLLGEVREKAAEGSTTLACLTSDGRPQRIPESVRSVLARVARTEG